MKGYLLIILTLFLISGQSVKRVNRPNFLFIIVDDLRPQLGVYGHPEIKSPNIDRLAAEGLLFNRAYCNVPVCGASRASLLTGLRPHWPTRFTSFNTRIDKDYPDIISLPEHFRKNQYTTISNGKVFHHNNDEDEAWSEAPWRPAVLSAKIDVANSQWVDPLSLKTIHKESGSGPYFEGPDVPDNAYFDGQVAEKTINDLKRLAKADKPFFLAAGFIRPHLPFNAPKKYFDLYDKVQIADNRYTPKGLPKECNGSNEIQTYAKIGEYNSDDFHHEARRAYYACVSYIDAQVGKLLDALKETGKADQTVVVLIGDHGWHLGEHNFWGKHNVLENALRVPMIVRIPGIPSKRIDRVVEFVDLYPTLCSIANINLPDHLQGATMLPMIAGKDSGWKDAAISEWKGARTISTQRYAYTEWVNEKSQRTRMLFDHKTDPEENENRIDQPEYRAVADALSRQLHDVYNGMNDPKK